MRTTIILATLVLFFSACKKDKYTTAPQITYKSISPNEVTQTNQALPVLTLTITDAEGDLGLIDHVDTAWVYITNKLTNRFDSLAFPDIKTAGGSNFKADIEVLLNLSHNCTPVANITDTIYYDVYVKDFAKNKSNVISTPDPVYYRCF